MEKSRLRKNAQQLLNKKVKGIPLLVVILLCTSILTVSAIYYTWSLNLTGLTYPKESPDQAITYTDTFIIESDPVYPDILLTECAVVGIGYMGNSITMNVYLTLLDTSYTLLAGYEVTVIVKDPDSVIVYEFIPISSSVSVELNAGQTTTSGGSDSLTMSQAGTYTVEVTLSNMNWIEP